jgi:hypothetical protein
MTGAHEPEKDTAGPAQHRDFLPRVPDARGVVEPLPWTRLSRADCLLLALALHRSARDGREAALNPSEPESLSSN